MSKTSVMSLGITVTGDGEANSYKAPDVTNTASPAGGQTAVTLSSGFNAITKLTGAIGCVITPPAGSTTTKTLKGVTGDTGVALALDTPSMITFPSSPSTFGITTNGSETVLLHWF